MTTPSVRANLQASLLSATSLCAVAVLAACGASGSSSSAGSRAFLVSANHVCSVYYNDGYALAPPIGLKQLADLAQKQQLLRERELSGLKDVTPPPALKAGYKQYLSDMAAFNSLAAASAGETNAELLADAGKHLNPRELERSLRAHRPLSLSPAQRAYTQRAEGLQMSLKSQARALRLTECAKNPYSAGHSFNENSGPEDGPK